VIESIAKPKPVHLRAQPRMPVDEYYIRMAYLASSRATCARRKVGCVLVDEKNRVLSIGYNGVAPGLPHCTTDPCAGATAESGEDLHLCEATHAEISAILALSDPRLLNKMYVTISPCINCVRLLLATSCQEIIYCEDYPHKEAQELWLREGRLIRKHCHD